MIRAFPSPSSSSTIRAIRVVLAALVVVAAGVAIGWDPSLADAFVVRNTNNGGPDSLRKAIQQANDHPVLDVIRFNIQSMAAVKTIALTTPLAAITDQVTIDGYSQPGAQSNSRPARAATRSSRSS